MPLNVKLKTRIRVNGRDYDSVEALPAEARAAYEKALAAAQGNPGSSAPVRTVTKIVFNGREYASAEEMPPELRAQYDRLMEKFDADHNGVPDVLEAGAAQTPAPVQSPARTQPPLVSGEPAPNRRRLLLALALLALFAGVAVLGVLVLIQAGPR